MKAGLILAILFGSACIGRAGAPPAKQPTGPPPNPLSFLDGRIVFGIEDRIRFEYRENNYDFDNSARTINDDAWFLNRLRLSLQLKPADWFTVSVQGQDSREIGSGRPDVPGRLGAEGDNPFDLREACFEVGDGKSFPLSFKAGRQVLLYGDQRLIGSLDWNNLSRTFDAAKLRWTGGDGVWVDAFLGSVVVPDEGGFDRSDWDAILSGVYAHIPMFGIQETEIYALDMDDTDRDDHFVTMGTHLKSVTDALGAWDYEAEFAVQTGTAAGRDLAAFAGYIEGGYTMGGAWKPRVGLEYSYGSGDGDPADGDEGAFQNLYPTNHLNYGYMDVFSWSNIHDAVLHLGVKPAPKLAAGIDWHLFWLDETADTWRRANAKTAVRPASPAASNYAGSEVDVLVTYAPWAQFSITGGYSRFFAGSYLGDTGAGGDADFVYVMTTVKF